MMEASPVRHLLTMPCSVRWIAAGRLAATGLLICAGLAGCDDGGRSALDSGDPLHSEGIRLPPENLGMPPRAVPETGSEVEPVVAPPPFTPGIFPCTRCHEGGDEAEDALPAIPHLLHLDEGLECSDCHRPRGKDGEPSIPRSKLCQMCHGDPEEDVEGVRAYFAAIGNSDGDPVFPDRWATRDTIPNHAGHAEAGVDCAGCHGEPAMTPFVRPKSLALMQLCVKCHQRRDVSTDCSTCHREIREPQHADIVLRHSEDMRGCLDCHDADDRDQLHLANGTEVPFERSYLLCGQCHGPKLRDWREGLHGKRTGMWNGKRSYLLCVHCHQNPHQPAFPSMKPMPPPPRPEDIR